MDLRSEAEVESALRLNRDYMGKQLFTLFDKYTTVKRSLGCVFYSCAVSYLYIKDIKFMSFSVAAYRHILVGEFRPHLVVSWNSKGNQIYVFRCSSDLQILDMYLI